MTASFLLRHSRKTHLLSPLGEDEMLQNLTGALPILRAPTHFDTSMNDCGEFRRNVGMVPISAAAEYRRDGRVTSGLNGARV